MTFYRHFPSKARLVAEYLAQKELAWQQLLAGITNDSSKTPLERVLAIFDALEHAIKSRDSAAALSLRPGGVRSGTE